MPSCRGGGGGGGEGERGREEIGRGRRQTEEGEEEAKKEEEGEEVKVGSTGPIAHTTFVDGFTTNSSSTIATLTAAAQ